jgi:hypothetical protein
MVDQSLPLLGVGSKDAIGRHKRQGQASEQTGWVLMAPAFRLLRLRRTF